MNLRTLRTRSLIVSSVLALTGGLALTACGSSGAGGSGGSGGITSALWDPAQLPVYQQCAAAFTKQTGIKVEVQQTTWTNYWSKLTTQLAAGAGPDVFTDHVNYFDQFQSAGQLLDLSPSLKKDGVDLSKDDAPSNTLWNVGGKQYALSQDKDVTGLLYNTMDLPPGTSAGDLSTLTWNPTDGGTFQKMIEHLTIDKNGHRGDEPGFDPNNVKTYGFAMETDDGISGQVSFAPLALSTGWTYTDKNPYGSKYNLDDARLAQTWTWLQKMYKGGFIAPAKLVTSLGEQPVLDQNVTATMIQGSWEASQRTATVDKAQTFQWAQLPSGPLGHPATITNSIGPSVNAASKHPDDAAKWAEFIVSPTCADIVATSGVEIPVYPPAAQKALATLKNQGVDTTGWDALFGNPQTLNLWPLTKSGAQINELANTAFDVNLPAGRTEAPTVLAQLNGQVNSLLH